MLVDDGTIGGAQKCGEIVSCLGFRSFRVVERGAARCCASQGCRRHTQTTSTYKAAQREIAHVHVFPPTDQSEKRSDRLINFAPGRRMAPTTHDLIASLFLG